MYIPNKKLKETKRHKTNHFQRIALSAPSLTTAQFANNQLNQNNLSM